MSERIHYSVMPSPVGELTMTMRGESLTGVFFENARELSDVPSWTRDDARLRFVRAELEAYFRGERTRFDVPLALHGTPFQVRVWQALREIPFGTTVSYGELARTIRRPDAMRAVGAANGRNPIVIMVPCHRVIGADGSLTGFGGGLPRKRLLLDLEQRVTPTGQCAFAAGSTVGGRREAVT
jgi:methylated-DNA-[protein]-cysteine S-methyltransferase